MPTRPLTGDGAAVTIPCVEEIAERFLEEESSQRAPSLDPMDRARFHRIVRQCAANWLLHPRAGLRITRGKKGLALHFEGPVGGKTLAVFSLRAHHPAGEYRFLGPAPDRAKLGLGPEHLAGLGRLRDLYEAVLDEPGAESAGESVNAVILGQRTPDVVPLVEETRRLLDGGDGASVDEARPTKRQRARTARSKGSKPAEKKVPPPVAAPLPEPLMPVVADMRLTSPEPKELATFYGRLFKLKPVLGGDRWEFDLGAFRLVIQGDLSKEERKLFGYGTMTKGRGFGARWLWRVGDYDLCLRRARKMVDAVLSEDREAKIFTVRDPAGYVFDVGASAT